MIILHDLEAKIRQFSPEQVSTQQDVINRDPTAQRGYKESLEAVEALRQGTADVIGLEYDSLPGSLSLGDMSDRSLLTIINRGRDGNMELQTVDPNEVRVITIAIRMPRGKG